MFRKPKKDAKNTKVGLRRKRSDHDDDDNDDADDETNDGMEETNLASARHEQATLGKRVTKKLHATARTTTITTSSTSGTAGNAATTTDNTKSLLHQFERSQETPATQKDLATRTNEHHPTTVIDRNNKFLAGPIKAPTNIRTTSRFDYQPDICKDYKDTGFCGFGDTCIYLHDRGDFLSGWQLEQQWQQEQEAKKQKQKEQIDAFLSSAGSVAVATSTSVRAGVDTVSITIDGLPFACHICREFFKDPVVTNCCHYFCQACLLGQVKTTSSLCPICTKETNGVFHQPIKLLNKKRKVCGKDSTWQDFQMALQPRT